MKKFLYRSIQAPAPDGVHQKSKLYSIYLAPGVTRYFKSYKSAVGFSNEYGRQVTRSLHTFNILLSELYSAHRSAWFYYFDRATGTNHSQLESKIEGHIRDAETWLHRAIFNTSGHYTGGSVAAHLEHISEALQDGFTILSGFLYARRLYTESERLKIFAHQASGELQRISNLYYQGGR